MAKTDRQWILNHIREMELKDEIADYRDEKAIVNTLAKEYGYSRAIVHRALYVVMREQGLL